MGLGRTGNATDNDVASSAAMSVRMQRLPNAAWKRHPGLNFSGSGEFSLSDAASLSGSEGGIVGFIESSRD